MKKHQVVFAFSHRSTFPCSTTIKTPRGREGLLAFLSAVLQVPPALVHAAYCFVASWYGTVKVVKPQAQPYSALTLCRRC